MSILETQRLMLRELGDEHAAFILELLNEPAFLRYIGDKGVRDEESARRYIQDGPRASYGQHGFGLYLVEQKGDGAPVGICGFLQRETLPDPDLGFAFLARYRSRGYATEAGVATMAYGRETLGMNRLLAITSPDNAASIRVLTKMGFVFDRTVDFSGDDDEQVNLFVSET